MSEASAAAPEAGVAAAPGRAYRVESMVFVGLLIALAVSVLLTAGAIPEPASAAGLGPRVIPYAVGGLMLAASVAVFVGQLRGRFGEPDGGEDIDLESSTSWVTTAIVVLAFVSLIITIPALGWPLAVTILFAGAAIPLGAKRWWVAVLVGFGLGVATWFAFGQLLGLSLPATGYLTSWIGI